MRSCVTGLSLLLLIALGLAASAQNNAVDEEGHQWWQHAVFYEIYPRSFADSNNDGIGDIPGTHRSSTTCIGSEWMRSGLPRCFPRPRWIGDMTFPTIIA
jgi:hypothetical protein